MKQRVLTWSYSCDSDLVGLLCRFDMEGSLQLASKAGSWMHRCDAFWTFVLLIFLVGEFCCLPK